MHSVAAVALWLLSVTDIMPTATELNTIYCHMAEKKPHEMRLKFRGVHSHVGACVLWPTHPFTSTGDVEKLLLHVNSGSRVYLMMRPHPQHVEIRTRK